MDLFQLTASLTLDLSEFENSISRASGLLGNFGTTMDTFGRNMEAVGDSLQAAFKPASDFAKGAIDSAIERESAWTGVLKTVNENGTATYEDLQDAAERFATSMSYSQSEVYKVMETVGQSTRNIDDVIPLTETALRLAASSNIEAEKAAPLLAKLNGIYGEGSEEAEKLASVYVALGNSMPGTEKEFLNMQYRMAGAAKQAGLTEAETAALTAGLVSLGVTPQVGGSSFSTLISRMKLATDQGFGPLQDIMDETNMSLHDLDLLAANSPSDFRKLADSLDMPSDKLRELVNSGVYLEQFADVSGMTSEQFVTAFQTDALGAIMAFIGGLANMNEGEESAISALSDLDLNTIRIRDTLLRTAGGADTMRDAMKIAYDEYGKGNALMEESDRRFGTMESSVKQFKNMIDVFLADVGEQLFPVVEKVLDWGGKIISFLDSMPDSLFETIATIGLVGSAVGGIISTIGAAVTLFSGPGGWIALAVAAVAAAAAIIIANWDKIKEFFGNLASWFGERIETIKGELHDWAEYFRGIGDKISTVCNAIGQFFSDAWGAAKTAVQKQLDDMVTAYESHDNKVEGILAAGWELMTSGWDAAWTFVNELTNGKLEEIAGAIGDWVSARLEAIGQFFSNMQEKVKSGLEAVKNFFTNGFETIKQTITTFVTQAITKITEFVQNVKNKIEEFKNNLIEKFEKLKSDVVAKVTKIKDDAVEGFRTLVETVRTKISEFPGIVIGKIEEVTSFISGLPGKMLNWGRDMIQSFVNGITQTWESIKSNVVGIADWVAGIFGHSHPDFGPMADDYKWMPDMMTSFARGIRDNRDLVLGEMQGLADDMAGTMGFSYGPAYTAPRTAPMTAGGGANGGGHDSVMLTELRETLSALRNMKVVMDTGETVGVLTAPMNNSLGNQYVYASRGIA